MIPTGKANLLANLTTGGFFVTLGQFCLTPTGLSFLSTVATALLSAWARTAAGKERDAVRAAELERTRRENYRDDRILQRFRATVEEVVDVAVRQAMTRESFDRAQAERIRRARSAWPTPDLKIVTEVDGAADVQAELVEACDAIDSHDPRYWVNLPSPDEPHPNHDDHAAQSDRARG